MLTVQTEVPIGLVMEVVKTNHGRATPRSVFRNFSPPFPEKGIIEVLNIDNAPTALIMQHA